MRNKNGGEYHQSGVTNGECAKESHHIDQNEAQQSDIYSKTLQKQKQKSKTITIYNNYLFFHVT